MKSLRTRGKRSVLHRYSNWDINHQSMIKTMLQRFGWKAPGSVMQRTLLLDREGCEEHTPVPRGIWLAHTCAIACITKPVRGLRAGDI